MRKVALITGINGMDAHYLSAHLIRDGYVVHGMGRDDLSPSNSYTYHKGDITCFTPLCSILKKIKPTHIFNLAGQSNVANSFDSAMTTTDCNAFGTTCILEAYREICPEARFFQASSSEMFGNSNHPHDPKYENTPMDPVTPYGLSKLYAHKMCQFYRDRFKLFISCGIMFNHTSEIQSDEFLIPKVIKAAVSIKRGEANELKVGNTEVRRDWGHSCDYTMAMKLMLEHSVPDDFVISSGRGLSVYYLIKCVFDSLELDYKKYTIQDPALIRPVDQICIYGDSMKAKNLLKWEPTRTFEQMIREMVMDKYNK